MYIPSFIQDQFGLIKYRMIGDDSGPGFFELNEETGEITLKSGVETDIVAEYRVRTLFLCMDKRHIFYLFCNIS